MAPVVAFFSYMGFAVAVSAASTPSMLSEGFTSSISATTPLRCGVAMEVPSSAA